MRKINWKRGTFRVWVIAALAWCVYIPVSALQRDNRIELHAPPCENGTDFCHPADRVWGEWDVVSETPVSEWIARDDKGIPRIKSGYIVSESGRVIIKPSAWLVLAKAIPMAIGPPLGVLVLGFLLSWVIAGFRGQT
jgi:hypothetical protein